MRAFVLSGEGAKSAFQIGVMQKLQNHGITPDYISGISSGALTAALYGHLGLEGLKKISLEQTNSISDVFRFNWNFLWKRGLFNTKPIEAKLKKIITHHEPLHPYGVSTFDIRSQQVKDWIFGEAEPSVQIRKVLAAIAIQGLVEPVVGEADAGLRQLIPVSQAIKLGATEIYVIIASPPFYGPYDQPKGFLSFAKIIHDSITFLINRNFVNDLVGIYRHNSLRDKPFINIKVIGPETTIGHQLEFGKLKDFYRKGLMDSRYYEPEEIFPSERR